MSKSRDAFRTISEVSTALDTPAHVLRFWESKFTQVKPVKRAGGRRYYRPADVNLLAGIKQLLHEDGMTIKGAQKLLREQGVKHVSALGAAALADMEPADIEATAQAIEKAAASTIPAVQTPTEPVENTAAPIADVDITNIVKLPSNAQPTQTGPALTLNLSGPATTPPAPENAATAPTQTAATAPPNDTLNLSMPDVPADPSDSDSKRPARIFHLLQNTRYTKLAAQRDTIAPLLGRMQGLRDRIPTR